MKSFTIQGQCHLFLLFLQPLLTWPVSWSQELTEEEWTVCLIEVDKTATYVLAPTPGRGEHGVMPGQVHGQRLTKREWSLQIFLLFNLKGKIVFELIFRKNSRMTFFRFQYKCESLLGSFYWNAKSKQGYQRISNKAVHFIIFYWTLYLLDNIHMVVDTAFANKVM